MPSKQTLITTTRSVTFSEKARVRRTLHIKDYTEDQKRAAFYNAAEMDVINRDNKATLRKMQKNQNIDEIESSTRGLERHLREAAKLRNVHKRAAVSVVLAHQYKSEEAEIDRYNKDLPKQDSIAQAYSSLTGSSTVSAYVRGLDDAKAAYSTDFPDKPVVQVHGDGVDHEKSKTRQQSKNAFPRIGMMRMRGQTRRQIVNSAA